MNLFATSPEWMVWVLVALLVAATIQDAVQLRISNMISAAVLLLALAAMVMSGLQVALWQNFAVFLLVLAVGAFLFARNVLGGGDVKLLAALGLWTDFGNALWLLVSIAIAGGLLAVTMITLRSFVPAPVASRVRVLQRRAGIPYGIAITAGTLLVLMVPGTREKQVPYVPINVPPNAPASAG